MAKIRAVELLLPFNEKLSLPATKRRPATTASPAGICGKAFWSAALYGFIALSMTFLNKAALQHFPLVTTALLLQLTFTVVILCALSAMKLLSLPRLNLAKARQLAPVTLLYTTYTAVALYSLLTLNVPMYSVLKRLTPIIVLITKSVWKRVLPAHNISASVIIIMVGTIVAGYHDLTFDLQGYVLAIGSCFLQALYLLLVEFTGAEQGVGTEELMLYNAILSIPILSAIAWVMGEIDVVQAAIMGGVHSVGSVMGFTSLMLVFAMAGTLLNYSLFLCTIHNSALTTTIVGALKSCVSVVLGFFVLGGVPFNAPNVVGITLNTVGGVWYSWVKYTQKVASHADPMKCVAQSASQPLLLGKFVNDDAGKEPDDSKPPHAKAILTGNV